MIFSITASADAGAAFPAPTRPPSRQKLLVATIQADVARYFGTTKAKMTSAAQTAEISRPRQIAIYLCREFTTATLAEIGRRFGSRDHSTVKYAIRHVEGLRAKDPEVDADVTALEQYYERRGFARGRV